MTPQRKAIITIDKLLEMVHASEQMQKNMPVEIETAEMMRQDRQTFLDAIELLRDAYKVTKH